MGKSVLIAIPAFNEAENIKKVINAAKNFGHVVVFNNNSTDDTEKICLIDNIQINNVKDQGYENVVYSITNYFLNSNFNKLVIIDGDGEVGVDKIDEMIKLLDRYEIVVGKREVITRISEKIICFIHKTFFNVEDVFCGFKGFQRSGIASKLVKNTYSTSVFRKSSKKTSIPVKVYKRNGSSRLGSGIKLEMQLFLGGLRGLFS